MHHWLNLLRMGKPASGGKAGKLRKAKAKQQHKNNKRRVKIQKGILPNSTTDAPRKEQGKAARAARYEPKQPAADKKAAKEAKAVPKGRGRGRVMEEEDDSPARPAKKPKLSAAAAEDERHHPALPALPAADAGDDLADSATAGDADELQKQQAVLGRFYGLVDPAKTPEDIIAILGKRRGELPAVSPADFSLLCAKLRGKYKIDPVTLASIARTAAAPAAAVLELPAAAAERGVGDERPAAAAAADAQEQESAESAELPRAEQLQGGEEVAGVQPGAQPGTEAEADATVVQSTDGPGSALQRQVDDALADGARDTAGQLNVLLRELAQAAETKALIRIWDKLVRLEGDCIASLRSTLPCSAGAGPVWQECCPCLCVFAFQC